MCCVKATLRSINVMIGMVCTDVVKCDETNYIHNFICIYKCIISTIVFFPEAELPQSIHKDSQSFLCFFVGVDGLSTSPAVAHPADFWAPSATTLDVALAQRNCAPPRPAVFARPHISGKGIPPGCPQTGEEWEQTERRETKNNQNTRTN